MKCLLKWLLSCSLSYHLFLKQYLSLTQTVFLIVYASRITLYRANQHHCCSISGISWLHCLRQGHLTFFELSRGGVYWAPMVYCEKDNHPYFQTAFNPRVTPSGDTSPASFVTGHNIIQNQGLEQVYNNKTTSKVFIISLGLFFKTWSLRLWNFQLSRL